MRLLRRICPCSLLATRWDSNESRLPSRWGGFSARGKSGGRSGMGPGAGVGVGAWMGCWRAWALSPPAGMAAAIASEAARASNSRAAPALSRMRARRARGFVLIVSR